ncbi:MAG: hypothetical protein ACI9BD_000068 [Candidatus Marinamargulisbacteria bacterium]|jgi:hypothetical protein
MHILSGLKSTLLIPSMLGIVALPCAAQNIFDQPTGVGIGTASPVSTLHVHKIDNTWNPNIFIDSNGTIGANGIRIRGRQSGLNFDIFSYDHNNNADDGLYFGISQNGPDDNFDTAKYNPQMVILSNGQILMNETAPFEEAALTVKGLIAAGEIKVRQALIADYVFEKAYDLKSLPELEAFILTYKHLPGMPSQDQVEKEGGINVGALQVKLLEKIEELTLHIIAQDKKMNAQQQRISSLETQSHLAAYVR